MKAALTHRFVWIVLTLTFASCNGSGTSVPVTQGSQRTSTSSLNFGPAALAPMQPIHTTPGGVDGLDDRFSPVDGDTSDGGQGSTIDGKVPCLQTMGEGYHVHAFIGIVDHGQMMALPDRIGMVKPGAEVDGYTNTAQCFYEIHTHDATGIVHLEVFQPHPVSAVVFKLKNLLDVWGVPHGEKSFGPFTGKIRVYVGMPPAIGQTTVTAYAPFTGKQWTDIGLRSHEVIWIEIGKPYYNAAQLPPVTFYMEY